MIMTKADVLSGFENLRVATAYLVNGKITTEVPFDTYAHVEPVYSEIPGWKEDISAIRKKDDLPEKLKAYVRFIENYIGVPVSIVSVGPDREATVMMG
jgi:adenylosuccinate synthase